MKLEDGWLTGARRIPSPNYDERPNDEISLVVIHCISLPAGHYGNDYVQQLFCNQLDCDAHPDFDDIRSLNVSSHLFVRRSGELIQFVPLHRRAWHAGESLFRGREQCNDFSIGVELEGTDRTSFTDAQYRQLQQLGRLCAERWSLAADQFVGHSDIAPGRKTDPGVGFDWQRFRQSLAGESTSQ